MLESASGGVGVELDFVLGKKPKWMENVMGTTSTAVQSDVMVSSMCSFLLL